MVLKGLFKKSTFTLSSKEKFETSKSVQTKLLFFILLDDVPIFWEKRI